MNTESDPCENWKKYLRLVMALIGFIRAPATNPWIFSQCQVQGMHVTPLRRLCLSVLHLKWNRTLGLAYVFGCALVLSNQENEAVLHQWLLMLCEMGSANWTGNWVNKKVLLQACRDSSTLSGLRALPYSLRFSNIHSLGMFPHKPNLIPSITLLRK